MLLFLCSCAKTKYLFEQGSGQFSLLWNAQKNEDLLRDPKVKTEIKDKVRTIQKYKKHFYTYWAKKPTKIYSKTTMLKGEAVTYLVISSKFYEIKALKECFPFLGCFPYIGFFNKQSALEYRKTKEKNSYETYMRPVYAYSTLGYFTDSILSSFFYYKDVELSRLIFHELFHTILFVKDEVSLNENLANYFSKDMSREYFSGGKGIYKKNANTKKSDLLRLKLVELIKKLNHVYIAAGANKLSVSEAKQKRDEFLTNNFLPEIELTCKENGIENCYPLKRKWNNASFAAFMTYEKKANKLKLLHDKLAIDLKAFYRYIEKDYETYKNQDIEGKFEKYLFREL